LRSEYVEISSRITNSVFGGKIDNVDLNINDLLRDHFPKRPPGISYGVEASERPGVAGGHLIVDGGDRGGVSGAVAAGRRCRTSRAECDIAANRLIDP
jgi:hypothetical protein